MALPDGVTTCTVTAGVPVTHTGAPVKAFVSIEPSVFLIHTATGTPLVDFLEELSINEGVAGQFTLPHTDQAGFQDENGNAYTNWYYTARISYLTPSKSKTKAPKIKVFQLATGQSIVDLDALPGGAPALPYTAPIATVLAVNGRTGNVTIEDGDLPARLSATALEDADTASRAVAVASATAAMGRPPLAKFRAAATERRTRPVPVVMLGSSTTAGGNATVPANRYVNRLAAILQAEYPSGTGAESTPVILDGTFATPVTTPGLHFYNGGIPGARSDVYVTQDIANKVGLIAPVMVTHMVGSNDWTAGYEPADTKANILAKIAMIDAACTVPPVHLLINQYLRYDYVGPKLWSAYGAVLKEIAATNPERFWYIDLNPVYSSLDIPGADPLKMIDTDRTHQTDAGHQLMADLLRAEFGIPGQLSLGTAYTSTVDVLKRTAAPGFIRDNFNRADGALGTSDSGHVWDAAGFSIVGNKAQCAAGGNAFLTQAHADIDLTVTVVVDASSTAPGVLFRSFDGGNRLGVFIDKAQTVFLGVLKNNVPTNYAGGWAPVAGTHTLRIVARGTQINAYLDGRLALAHTLSQADYDYFAPGTKLGFRCGVASTGVSFDSLNVKALT